MVIDVIVLHDLRHDGEQLYRRWNRPLRVLWGSDSIVSAEHPDAVPTPTVGDLLVDTRNSEPVQFRLLYIDENIAVLKGNSRNTRSGDVRHWMERRREFDKYVEAGRLKPGDESADSPAMPGSKQAVEMDWTEIDGVGTKTADGLRSAGIETDRDAQRAGSDKLLEIYGMSERIIENMVDAIEQT